MRSVLGMKWMAVLATLLLAGTLLATVIIGADNSVTVQPGDSFVLATLPLDKGDGIRYWFSATDSVSFDISPYGGDSLVELHVPTASAEFKAPHDGSYQVRVENPNPEAVTVAYDVNEVDSPFVAAFLISAVAAISAFVVILAVFVAVRTRGYPPRGV